MGTYAKRLAQMGETPLEALEGPEGMLAVTERELLFLGPEGVTRLELAQIRRVVRGEGGVILIQGLEGTMAIPMRAFPQEALKAFLEGLRPHVLRARAASRPPQTPQGVSPRPQEGPPPEAKTPSVETREGVQEAPSPRAPALEGNPPVPRPRPLPLALPLRVIALLALGYMGAFLALNPGADPWALLGVTLGGLGLALTAWAASTSLTSSR